MKELLSFLENCYPPCNVCGIHNWRARTVGLTPTKADIVLKCLACGHKEEVSVDLEGYYSKGGENNGKI